MDDEHLDLFEAKFLCLSQVFAECISIGILFRHNEQDWMRRFSALITLLLLLQTARN